MRQGEGTIVRDATVRVAEQQASWLAFATIGFAGLAVLFLTWPLYRILLSVEVDTNEGWNAWQTVRAMGGGPLYPSPDDLTANNYPPLSFYLVGLISSFTGDIIIAGRFLSLTATFGVAWATFGCLGQLGVSRTASAFAVAWLIATLARHYEHYVGMNDPHMLALAIMTCGLARFLALSRDGRATEPALAVMVLAGFFKHSLWAIPMTALLWLAWQDGARALRAVLFSAALAAAGLAGCLALWGPDFLWNLAAPREATLWRGFIMLGRLQMIAPAIVLWGFWLYARRGTQTARFSALFLGLAFVVYIVQVRASGVDVNSQFELLVATAIALGLAVEGVDDIRLGRHVGVERVRHWILALLVLRLLASTQFAPFQILVSPTYRSSLAEQVAVTESEIARVAGLPDPVSCSIPTVCFRAGRAFAYDGFLMHQRVTTGAWSLGQLRAAVNAKGLRFETVDPRTEWDRDAMPALLGMILRKPPRKPAIALPRDLSEAQ